MGCQVEGDGFHGGGFAGAVGPEESEDLAGFYRKRYIVHRFLGAIPLGDVFNNNVHFVLKILGFSKNECKNINRYVFMKQSGEGPPGVSPGKMPLN